MAPRPAPEHTVPGRPGVLPRAKGRTVGLVGPRPAAVGVPHAGTPRPLPSLAPISETAAPLLGPSSVLTSDGPDTKPAPADGQGAVAPMERPPPPSGARSGGRKTRDGEPTPINLLGAVTEPGPGGPGLRASIVVFPTVVAIQVAFTVPRRAP